MTNKQPSFATRFKNAVPPRARAMLILVLCVFIFFSILIVRSFTHKSTPKPVAAEMDVKMNVSNDDLRRPVAGDEKVVPDDSPIANTVKEINKAQYQQAQTTGGSYIAPVEMSSPAPQPSFMDAVESAAAGDAAPHPPAQKIQTGVDDVIAAQAAQLEQYKKPAPEQGSGAQAATTTSAPPSEYLRALLEKNQRTGDLAAKAISELSAKVDQGHVTVLGATGQGVALPPSAAATSPDGSEYARNFATPITTQPSAVGSQFIQAANTVPGANESLAAAGLTATQGQSAQAGTTAAPISNQNVGVKAGRVNLGDRFFAEMEGTGNTDEPSELTFTILQPGPLYGARLIGVPKLVGKKMTIDCNAMTLRNRDYSVKAKVIDIVTGDARLADDVNNHYLTRWGSLGVAAFAEGYARALSGTTTVSDGTQTTTTTEPIPDTSDQIKVGIGNMGEKAIPILQKNFDTPPTVKLFGEDGVGILFLNSFDILM